uniref:Uncharacterized protein n=1 Tax=Anguilla anguilla TaxID=7936 RepID=A0A0E9RSR9_ANGAN
MPLRGASLSRVQLWQSSCTQLGQD